MTWYRLKGAAGIAFHELRRGEALPEGATPVDRAPGPFEDFIGAEWVVTDPRALADWRAGPAHIAEARALKFLEAQMIAAGIDLPNGMLAREAAERGEAPEDLAATVLERRADFVAREINRQREQAGQFNKDDTP